MKCLKILRETPVYLRHPDNRYPITPGDKRYSLKTMFIQVFCILMLIGALYGQTPISGYVQVQYSYDFSEDTQPTNEFQIRRARVKFRYMITDKIRTRIEIDCGRAVLTIKDIYLQYKLNPFLNITLGQHKMPMSLEQLHSARELLVIDRGAVNDIFKDNGYIGRDVGISIEGSFFKKTSPLGYALGVFNGNGYRISGDNDDTKQFAERITFGPTGNISVGINSTQRADSITREALIAYGGDISYQKGGVTIEGELLRGETGSGATMMGFYGLAAYRYGRFEPAVKIERLYYNSDDMDDYLSIITYNIGWYLHQNVRLQANVITNVPHEQVLTHLFVIQAQGEF